MTTTAPAPPTSDTVLPEGSAARAPRLRRLTPGGAVVVWILMSVGLLAAWMLLFAFVFSAVQESRSQKLAHDKLREQLADATAPLGGFIKPGRPVALIDAPEVGLDEVIVVEGTEGLAMQEGPGHLPTSVLPGQAGVSVIYGRSVTFGAPFASLPSLVAGQQLRVVTGQGEFVYVVDGVRRPGDPLLPVPAATTGRLVLVTSQGQGWRAGWAPSEPVFVDATLVGQAQPTLPGRPTSVPPAQKPMGRDQVSLLPLLLWTQLFLVASATLVWTWYRWGRWQTWLVGLPVLLAVLWGLGENALALLPNLI